MKIKNLPAKILLLLTLCCSFQAAAQDLKPVRDKQTKKYGYQAKDKTWVIEPRFDGASRFNDGFAEVTLDGKKGLIDADGQMILQAEYDDIKKFEKNGLCEVIRKEGKTKLHGVADRSGRTGDLPAAVPLRAQFQRRYRHRQIGPERAYGRGQ